jgi:FixJ family two-component response regulator
MDTTHLVLVVDDDLAMRQSVARLPRQFGYDSLLFRSAKAFANHRQFDRVICILLDINLGDGRARIKAPSRGERICAGHPHDWERYPCPS